MKTNFNNITVTCHHCRQTYDPEKTIHYIVMATETGSGGHWMFCYNKKSMMQKFSGSLSKLFKLKLTDRELKALRK